MMPCRGTRAAFDLISSGPNNTICYWKPEDGLESSLNIFFDATAEDNLGIESIYALAAGLVRMFENIALRHG